VLQAWFAVLLLPQRSWLWGLHRQRNKKARSRRASWSSGYSVQLPAGKTETSECDADYRERNGVSGWFLESWTKSFRLAFACWECRVCVGANRRVSRMSL
jgi:hypothetical protein